MGTNDAGLAAGYVVEYGKLGVHLPLIKRHHLAVDLRADAVGVVRHDVQRVPYLLPPAGQKHRVTSQTPGYFTNTMLIH